MEAKHTNWPWNIDLNMVHYDPPHFDIRDKDGRRIGTVMGTYPMGPKTEEANARLIAAAPELLAALLEMAEDYCEMCRDECRNGGCVKFPEEAVNGNSMYPVCENVKRAKKAIAKAKGEA